MNNITCSCEDCKNNQEGICTAEQIFLEYDKERGKLFCHERSLNVIYNA